MHQIYTRLIEVLQQDPSWYRTYKPMIEHARMIANIEEKEWFDRHLETLEKDAMVIDLAVMNLTKNDSDKIKPKMWESGFPTTPIKMEGK